MIDISHPDKHITYIYLGPPKEQADETKFMQTLNKLLESEKFILIIEVSGEASFSPHAKKELGTWFKSNKVELKKRCMAFIRVADESSKLKRFKSKAMRLAMPCPYFVEPNRKRALSKAQAIY